MMTKSAVTLILLITSEAVYGATLPSPEKNENLIEDLFGIQDLQNDRQVAFSRAREAADMSTPITQSVTVTTATPPTPPTPGVVTVTSSPSHANKYLKKIERLLFAILLVVTAIFTLLAAKFVFSAVIKIASSEKEPKYKKFSEKKNQMNNC